MSKIRILKNINKIRELNKVDWGKANFLKFEKELNIQIEEFEKELHNVTDPQILRSIIAQDEDDYFMPISTMFKIYQRLITLQPNDKNSMKKFSNYLLIYGPDWEEEAKKIADCIDDNKLDEALSVSMHVDYDKYAK